MSRSGRLLLLSPLLLLCLGAKLEKIEKLQAEGDHAKVVEQIAEWKAKGALGKEEAELLAAMAKSAFELAKASGKAAALGQFRADHPDSALVADALKLEYDRALNEAQTEGTVAAMAAYRSAYPQSPYLDRALAMEQGWAYEDVIAEGTMEALDRFLAMAGDSPYKATAWEAVVAKHPGIHVLGTDGRPTTLQTLLVSDGHISLPGTLPYADPRLTFAVNVDGAGRGSTSEWFSLRAVGADGALEEVLPLELALKAATRLEFDTTAYRQLDQASGAHTARVAHALRPLLVPGSCTGDATFAFLVRSPGGAAAAYPFRVACPTTGAAWGTEPDALLFAALELNDAGDRAGAVSTWDKLAGMSAARPLLDAMRAVVPDPKAAVLDSRPSAGDFLVWTVKDGKPESAWVHADSAGAPRVLARRAEVVLAVGGALQALRATEYPWSGCKPTIAGAALVPMLGGTPLPVLGDATTRLAGMAARTITPLASVGPYLFLGERAEPCKTGRSATTWVAVNAGTGEVATVLTDADQRLVDATLALTREQLRAKKDLTDLDQLAVAAQHPAFPNGGDLAWRLDLVRGRGAPLSVDAPALPAAMQPLTDTPALVEAFWAAEPPGANSGYSRVEAAALSAYPTFATP